LPGERADAEVVLGLERALCWYLTGIAAVLVAIAGGGVLSGGWNKPEFAVIFIVVTALVCRWAWRAWALQTVCGPAGITGTKHRDLILWNEVDYFSVGDEMAPERNDGGVGWSPRVVYLWLLDGTLIETRGRGSTQYVERLMRTANAYLRVVRNEPRN
jgi:hypothetical protein